MRMFFWGLFGVLYVASAGGAGLPDGALVRAAAGSLIQAQTFPKTFSDLSFVDRMAIKADGYDDVGTEYDENGVCISGCAYVGMTLEDEERMIERATNELQQLVALENARRGYYTPQAQQQQPQLQTQQQFQYQMPQQQVPYQQPQQVQYQHPQQNSAPVQQSSGGGQVFFGPPVHGDVKVGSDFGERRPPKTKGGKTGSRYHRGLDVKASTGTPLYAAADGKVVLAGNSGGYGKVVKIEHPFSGSNKTAMTVYAHMSQIDVRVGDTVTKGQRIGAAGNTGNSGGAHLHYELRFDNVRVDPLGSKIKPVIDKEVAIASSTSGTNYLGAPYCIKKGISSTRLSRLHGNDAAIRENFPQSTGWCQVY